MILGMSPTALDALGKFVEIAIRIGVTEGPLLVAMITAACAGTDPLAPLEREHVAGILDALKLEAAEAAEHLRRAHVASAA